MRKKYLTINKKLSAIILLFITGFAVIAKDRNDDTDIICFAAQNKWVCAPEDQQQIASEKATKLIKNNASELDTSEVVIKSIAIPKFNASSGVVKDTSGIKQRNPEINQVAQNAKYTKNEKPVNIKIKSESIELANDDNPYAKLWSHQLIGLSTPQSAINFVKQKKLDKDEVLIIKSIRANMDWWIVLYGLYKDKSTGLDNEINLPVNIDKPWLRPLKNLQVFGFVEKF